jgi:adenylate kinase family enzyme
MLLGKRRIMVIGSGGGGKSTFARELALRTGLPLVHLDRHYWRPGWVPTPRDEWAECVRQLSSGDSWILDGNYGGSLSIRVQRCDAIVFFDMPRLVCLRGVLQRWLVHQFKPRPDLAEGCPEKMDMTFLRWIWNYPRDSRARVAAALQQAGPDVEVLMITRRVQAQTILNAVSKRAA